MSKYEVWIKGNWHKHVGEVEAESLEQAIEKAEKEFDLMSPTLCHYCSSTGLEISDSEEVDVEID